MLKHIHLVFNYAMFHKIPFAKFDNLNYYNVLYQNLSKSSFRLNHFLDVFYASLNISA